MRIMVKGGVWKNTEDEILKAAVMKYGKNQWARISSLLTRKTAKQCKSRWYEWLDPSIKKTEWSREEEEKLLHLAKIMPNQWKTIAPIIGRTAAQCIEHYEKLLDAAQMKEEGVEAADDPRRLRPGEIDPNPEAKPARPDPIDMDEDEKEMLSEARARLANTKGKKAKRKAREKQLEEARRLASLQKRRELKAAGIDVPKQKKKQKGIDYSKEIPFQKKPAPGFYEVDWSKETPEKPSFKEISADQLERKRRREEEENHQQNKKQKGKNEKKVPQALLQINNLNDPNNLKNRSKLMLPSPQLDDDRLEEIARLEGYGSNPSSGTPMLTDSAEEGASFTKALLPAWGPSTPLTQGNTPNPSSRLASLRTPSRTPAREDNLMKEAQNLIALTASQTPLAGGDNPNLHPSDFSSATPKHSELKTPHALDTPARNSSSSSSSGGRDFFTPLRTPGGRSSLEDRADSKAQRKSVRRQLQSGLRSLPSPQNEYKFMLPELPNEEEEKTIGKGGDIDDDASEELRLRREREESERQAKLRMRSQVLQRNLPRPPYLDSSFSEFRSKREDPSIREAEDMLRREMVKLIVHEAIEEPPKNSRFRENHEDTSSFDTFEENQILLARKLIEEEVQNLKKESYPHEFSKEEFERAWSECYEEEVVFPSQKRVGRIQGSKQKKEKIDLIGEEFQGIKNWMEISSTKGGKIEQKVQLLFGGYQKRAGNLLSQIGEIWSQIDQSKMEINSFRRLRQIEEHATSHRLNYLQNIVEKQKEKEHENQQRYLNLITEKENLLTKA
eukprot:TRINITY_DN1527_c0_g1_i1.p1 TRINITY_DN1527_c0_g1~~TRINITY_DN1527_c0_g1_i1.p1  ORF type:complete len:786 (+),score=271.83 TRINITY_DN1527_c0_g1_i1:252-2609(+)